MSFYKRRFTHWHPEGRSIFLTCHLQGSLPASILRRPRPAQQSAGMRFVELDKEIDAAASGPVWLQDPRVAAIVENAIRKAEELGHYVLHAYVVMLNHVHILLKPIKPMSKITAGLKAASARHANKTLERTGQSFWQRESYDHWVRNDAEFEKIRTYIENNPVRARLAQQPELWRWSSANCRSHVAAAAGDCANLPVVENHQMRPTSTS